MLQIKRLELFCEMRQIAAEHLQRTAAVPGFQRNFVGGGRVARRAGAKPLLTGSTCFPFLFQKLH